MIQIERRSRAWNITAAKRRQGGQEADDTTEINGNHVAGAKDIRSSSSRPRGQPPHKSRPRNQGRARRDFF